MLRYLTADRLRDYPRLAASMFTARAAQFQQRLGWAVTVDAKGWERDEYDGAGAYYVIWERMDGTHGGSMRFRPTVGPTMVHDHFSHLAPDAPISNPAIWECTRFCLAEDADYRMSAALMLGGAEVGAGFGLAQAVGVFDARMVRIYRMLGWEPALIGNQMLARDDIGLGLWSFGAAVRRRMAQRAGISPEVSRHWFRISVGDEPPPA